MTGQNKILKAAGLILDLVLPRKCAVCEENLRYFEQHICTKCLADMPYTYYWRNSHNAMADKFNEKIQKHYYLDFGNITHPPGKLPYSYAVSLFFFNSEAMYRHIPYKIKYGGDIPLGYFFGKLLGEKILSSDVLKDIDTVIPVPLHWTRKWKRGYNQAEIIAKGIVSVTGTELCTSLLKRKHRTKTQTRLDIEGKSRNVKDAFTMTGPLTDRRHILLVDDVFTTGATLTACYTAISKSGNNIRISIATLAVVSN